MANGNVQRNIMTAFGAEEDTTPETISSVDVTSSFARLTNTKSMSGGPTANPAINRHGDDYSLSCLLTDATTVTVTRPAAGQNEDQTVTYEVIEFPADGNDAVVVRMHEDVVITNGNTSQDFAISSVGTLANCVPIICGITTTVTDDNADRYSVTAKCVSATGDKLRLERGDSVSTCTVSIAVLEFTGSNWTVQQNIEHAQTAAAVETETISSVTWADSMVFYSVRSDTSQAAANTGCVWAGAATTLKHYSASTNSTFVSHVVTNANLDVTHMDSIDGSESQLAWASTDPTTVSKTVTSSALAGHFVVASVSTTQTETTMAYWAQNYRLNSTTALEFRRSWSYFDYDDHWTAQLIDISGLVDTETTSALSGANRGVMRGVARGVG